MKDNCQSLCGRVDSQCGCKQPCHLEFPAYWTQNPTGLHAEELQGEIEVIPRQSRLPNG